MKITAGLVPEGDPLGVAILVRDGAELMLHSIEGVRKDAAPFRAAGIGEWRGALVKYGALRQQMKHQHHPAYHQQNNTDPHEYIERFLLWRRRVDANRHVETADQTAEEPHIRYDLRIDDKPTSATYAINNT